jgi:hypothetical protein
MKHKSAKTLLAVLFGTGFSAAQLHAQNTFFDTGDLILFFQKPGDDDTLYVGLGAARTLYRGTEAGPTADRQALNIVNINSALTTAYGAGWASDTGIYAGLAACRSTSTGIQVFEGDQTRTVYVSRPRNAVGTLGQRNSTAWDLTSVGNLTGSATPIVSSLSNDLETNYLTQVATAPLATSKIDDTNPFSSPGIQGNAFTQFVGGVQQAGSAASFGTFGPAGSVEFALDLNRIVPRVDSDTTGEVSGVRFIGSYEGTVVVGTNGSVSFITQGVASAYTDWAITNGVTGQAANLDHDSDGVSNGVEYFLAGPSTVSTGFTSLPGVSNSSGVNSTTWTKASTYTGVYGTDFWVETSTSLAAGSWTTETLGVNVVITGNNVKYTFPSGPVKTFVRLKVTGP